MTESRSTAAPLKESPTIRKGPVPSPNQNRRFSKRAIGMILGGVALVLLVIGAVVAFYLSQQSQDIRQQARVDEVCSPNSPAGGCGEGCSLSTQRRYCNSTGTGYTCYRAEACGADNSNPAIPSPAPPQPPQNPDQGGGSTQQPEVGCTLEGLNYSDDQRWCRDSSRTAVCNNGSVSINLCPTGQACQPATGTCITATPVVFTGTCSGTSVQECQFKKGEEIACVNGKEVVCRGNASGVCSGVETGNSCGVAQCKTSGQTCSIFSECCNGLTCNTATSPSTCIVSTPNENTNSNPGSGNTGGTGTGGTTTGDTIPAGQSCENTTKKCATGSYCTGVAGSRVCNVPAAGDNAYQKCIAGGGTCGGNYIAFHCNGFFSGSCNDSPLFTSDYNQAVAHAGSCGQVDQVCKNGTMNNQLCGDFVIFNSGCGGGGSSPNPSPSSSPGALVCGSACGAGVSGTCPQGNTCDTATNKCVLSRCLQSGVTCEANKCAEITGGGACLNITINEANPTFGSNVSFTCGEVVGAAKYEFRVKLPNGSFQTLAARSNNPRQSVVLKISQVGQHFAQCRICTSTDSASCQQWETLQ